MPTSDPLLQIAYALLRESRPHSLETFEQRMAQPLGYLDAEAEALRPLISSKDLCPACWSCFSNGTRHPCTGIAESGAECLFKDER